MITKDRYSQAFLFAAFGLGVFVLFLRADKGYAAAISVLIGILPLLYLATRSAKIHLPKEQKDEFKAEYKGERDCGFDRKFKTKVDGIRIDNTRYKFVNGTDICIDNSNINPCGIGSAIMQFIGGGGKEPKSIQNNKCWA